MPGGRPSDFTPEVANEICERLAHGEPLTVICRDDHMPSFQTVYNWEKVRPEFLDASTRAREIGTHFLAYDSLTIADGPGDPADKRIRIDTRIRLIGKWNRRFYGEHQTIEHEGGITTLTDEQIEAKIAEHLAAHAG